MNTGGTTHRSGGESRVSEGSKVINQGHSGIQVDALEEHHKHLVSKLSVAKI